MTTYAKWGNYEIRDVVNLFGKESPNHYDLVLWQEHDPYEVTDFITGERYTSCRSCFSLGFIKPDREGDYYFETTGTRYFDYYEHGLSEFVKMFLDTLK